MMMSDKIYKVLRIVAVTLAILSIIFGLYYKVSHAQTDSGTSRPDIYYPFSSTEPLRVASDMGQSVLSSADIEDMVLDLNSGNYPGYPYADNAGFNDINLILFSEYNSSGNYVTCYAYKDGFINGFQFPSTYPLEDISNTSLFCNFRSLNNYLLRFDYDLDDNSITYVTSTTGNCTITFYPLSNNLAWVENLTPGALVNVYALIPDKSIYGYPIFLRDGEMSYDGVVRFSTDYSSGGGGDGGNQDIIDNIDNSDDLPQVDDSDPSDSSSIPAWLKKILSALKSLNSNLRGIGVTIVNLLKDLVSKFGDLLDRIADFFSSFWQKAKDFFKHGDDDNWDSWKDTQPSDLVSALDNSLVFGGYSDFRTLVSDLDSCFDVTPVSEVPSWDIPLSGTVLETNTFNKITIDFSFFNKFKDTWLLFIRVIVCIAFALHVIHQIPAIFHGLPGTHDIDNVTRSSEPSPPPVFNTFVSGDLVKNYNSKRR